MTRLSIIIPCFNCADTLEQAVASVYRQDLQIPYDVTMVDDGSTDNTYEVMSRIAAEHSNVRMFRHASNRGGGAARNTAVANSRGDLLFCLDADDMLGDGCLRALTQFWLEKRCDGIGLGKMLSFRGNNIRNVAYVTEFGNPGRRIRFESFLSGESCALNVVFLISRRAMRAIGGYPTAHGFDTQGLGFRFLCHDLTAYSCPEAQYLHRVEYHESYYVREQNEDRLNWNWFNLLDEFLYLFSRNVQTRLLESDLFRVPGRAEPPVLLGLVRGRSDIYTRNYRHLLHLGPAGVARRLATSTDPRDQYWLGSYNLSRGRYAEAIGKFKKALALGFPHRAIHYRMLQASLGLEGSVEAASDAAGELALYCRPFPMAFRPLRHRLASAIGTNRVLSRSLGWLNALWIRHRDSHVVRLR